MEPSKAKSSLYSLARNKPYWLVLASGLLLGLSFPPFPFHFLALIGFVPLFFIVETVPPRVFEDKVFYPIKWTLLSLLRLVSFPVRYLISLVTKKERPKIFYHRRIISGNAQIFRYTYIAFFIWNLIGCYWLTFTVQGATTIFEALTYLSGGFAAIFINPALMAIPFQFYSRIRRVLSPVPAAAALILLWITFEHLHFRWELTWSWLTLGHAFAEWPLLIQFAEFTGVEGISLYILLSNLIIYQSIRHYQFNRNLSWLRLGSLAFWLILPLGLSLYLLNPSRDVFKPSGQLRLRMIQPNIDPFYRDLNLTREAHIQLFRDMMLDSLPAGTELVILPESAIPKSIRKSQLRFSPLLQPLWEVIDDTSLAVLTGFTEIRDFDGSGPVSAAARPMRNGKYRDFCNAAALLRPDEEPQTFQKSKLVPMVERMPFLTQLDWVRDHTGLDLAGYFSYGLPFESHPLNLRDSVKMGIMICYESEFGDFVRRQTAEGAQVLAIITNDGWWGRSSGYVQHASFARLRAIENRRDLARCANTGRTMLVDSRGRAREETAFWEPATVDGQVSLYQAQTFYVRHGDWIGFWAGWISLALLFGLPFISRTQLPKRFPKWFAKDLRPH